MSRQPGILKGNLVNVKSSLNDEKKKDDIIQFINNSKKININLFDLNIIKYILNKPKRSPDELFIIQMYLSSMKFLSTLTIPLSRDKLLYSLSSYLKVENKLKDTILFRYGSKGNKFYIVLKGEISILILKETKQTISFKRYFLHLLLLKMLKEDELVKKTIIANAKMKYHFDDKDFDEYYEKMTDFINKYFKKNKNDFNADNENEKNNKNDKQNEKTTNNESNSIIVNSRNKNKYLSNQNNSNYFRKSTVFLRNSNIIKKQSNSCDKNNTFHNKLFSTNNISQDKNPNNISVKSHILDKKSNNIKLKSRKTRFHSEERKNEINYGEIYLPYFNYKEIKEILFYFFYLKEKLSKQKKKISKNEYINSTYINSIFHIPIQNENIIKKEELIIFQYFEIYKKKVGDSFGELALQKEDNKRTGTALTASDCTLGCLTRTDYNLYLADIEVKKRKNEINYMMSFSIFDKMNKSMFENKYFNYFTCEKYMQGEIIIEQDKPINKVFFIKEGQIEITTNLSFEKIYSLLEYKTNKKLDSSKKSKSNNKIHKMRLYISNNKDILGLEDFINEEGLSFITARCSSIQVITFTIEKSILNDIKDKIPEIYRKTNKIIERREKVMIDRLINIYNRIVQINKNVKKEEKK